MLKVLSHALQAQAGQLRAPLALTASALLAGALASANCLVCLKLLAQQQVSNWQVVAEHVVVWHGGHLAGWLLQPWFSTLLEAVVQEAEVALEALAAGVDQEEVGSPVLEMNCALESVQLHYAPVEGLPSGEKQAGHCWFWAPQCYPISAEGVQIVPWGSLGAVDWASSEASVREEALATAGAFCLWHSGDPPQYLPQEG